MAPLIIVKEMKWLAVAAVIYLGLCVLMLFSHVQQSNIEPVELTPMFYRSGRHPKEVYPMRLEDLSHMTTLLRSPMFAEQGIKLKWIGERISRMSSSWQRAQELVATEKRYLFTNPKKILLFPGLLSEYSAYDFANNAYKGGYLGELVQWSDLISTLHMLGHSVVILTSRKQLTERVSLTELNYDLLFTDYIGLFALRDSAHFPLYKCRIRVLDSFGTEPIYNFRTKLFEAEEGLGMFNNWNFEDCRQFWTLFPHTPDNSFLGFVVDYSNQRTNVTKKLNQAVLYGKESWYAYGRESFLNTIGEAMELHSTFKDTGQSLPNHVINHGILPAHDLQRLLFNSKAFIGLGFPYDGPGPFEALANGCSFIQPKFTPPHDRHNTDFFVGKPTSRKLTSQVPYLENFVGKPYVYTVDISNHSSVREAVYDIISRKTTQSLVPYEFTQQGMLERVGTYVAHQNFCDGQDLARGHPATASSVFEDHTAGEAVDGLMTEQTCFWSAPDHTHWWMVDLGGDVNIVKIRVTNTFEWILAKSWGVVFVDPFVVTLTDSHGNQVGSKTFNDSRTFYIWEEINIRARYVRLDSLNYEGARYFVLCAVEVFGGSSRHPTWPDLSLLKMKISKRGQSCKEACLSDHMICEPAYFKALNKPTVLNDMFTCNSTSSVSTKYVDFLPAQCVNADSDLDVLRGICLTNENTPLLSCAGYHSNYQRLCPCRRYTEGQLAVPPSL